jgi:hypothetical protein
VSSIVPGLGGLYTVHRKGKEVEGQRRKWWCEKERRREVGDGVEKEVE